MTTPAMRPAQPHAVITGAAGGIGAAIARRLAADGCALTLVGRTAASLHDLAATIATECRVVVCDVADADAVRQAFGALPPVHVLVNNAGQAESAPVSRTSDALWERMLAVNLSGTFYCTRAVLDGMRQAGWGRVVNIASTAGQRGYAYVAAYAAAKHGVVGFTRSLALEVAAAGITVNAVCPGFTDTDMLARSVANIVEKTGRSEEEARAQLAALNPQRRFVTPDDVAASVAWLCTDGAAAVTGQSISVSGGEVM
ncbi:SDR family NAD(P)-dependent oxidoreductase [Gemmatimonas sp.]|jgi:NAD(P)-dependent dehydrogenase (short-subunit alcohol dehydrogenase family)|uniref:SDR family NAD(P)-dependent oxidoreductase n=1 Tax=Gemmatimonas sp. TaxID=1962908 RepID=UPI0037BEE3AC